MKQYFKELLNRRPEFMDDTRKEMFMKRNIGICCLFAICLLTGCSKAEALAQEQFSAAETTTASTAATQLGKNISTITTAAETAAVTDEPKPVTSAAETEAVTEQPETETPVTEPEPAQVPAPVNETFTGILIDECCSDLDDPSVHDLPCMLMDTCRASGYGLDIQQPDGSWRFVPFDENGQNLAWEYLNHTTRMDNLYVTVKGTLTDDIISVFTLEELP